MLDGWDAFGSGPSWGLHPGADDVAFIAATIDRLESTAGIDPDRVYVTGLSRGAMMSYRLGCELSARVAAIAPVSGNMATADGSAYVACSLARPVSVFAIHGTADGMIPSDAYLWAKYRDDSALRIKLMELTQNRFDSRRGFYGSVGEQCVIKNSGVLKDVKIGDHASIKGANKIKNVTVNSSADEQTRIGEGVELVNGIVGHGCQILYGCKALCFAMANNSNLKYGARLINSFLGENSTISCCEVLHNLIFPAHEQHHNNSFLIASLVMGQSNVAAGATIGSNHNGRSNDNEIQAGRGFWPGLCVSVKPFCLVYIAFKSRLSGGT